MKNNYMTICENNIILKSVFQGEDVQVFIENSSEIKERWFSIYNSKNESFYNASKRVFEEIAKKNNTKILPLV
jgi:hypothetical protein